MRLNLGCGRAQFPTTLDNPRTEHLTFLPKTAIDPSEYWVNVDRFPLDGVSEVVDLFTYPWVRSSNGNPWNDNSVDEIWISHLIEHIPHTARYGFAATDIHRGQGDLDGWYAFFYEAWRIMKPLAIMRIITPLANSNAAIGDPSHTRQILPVSFGYFAPSKDDPFDYQIAARFEQYGEARARPTPEWVERVKSENDSDAALQYSRYLNNVYDELYICLRAVKD